MPLTPIQAKDKTNNVLNDDRAHLSMFLLLRTSKEPLQYRSTRMALTDEAMRRLLELVRKKAWYCKDDATVEFTRYDNGDVIHKGEVMCESASAISITNALMTSFTRITQHTRQITDEMLKQVYAYCFIVNSTAHGTTYFFKKYDKGKILKKLSRFAFIRTASGTLDVAKNDIFHFSDSFDFSLVDDIYLIFNRSNFESIMGYHQQFMEDSLNFLEDLQQQIEIEELNDEKKAKILKNRTLTRLLSSLRRHAPVQIFPLEEMEQLIVERGLDIQIEMREGQTPLVKCSKLIELFNFLDQRYYRGWLNEEFVATSRRRR